MTEEKRLDELMEKVKRGIVLASKKFLREAKAKNQKLVIMRNGKVVLVNARHIKNNRGRQTRS